MMDLSREHRVFLRQRFEAAELFGFETRNKYEILSESGSLLGFAAEQQKGILGFLFRQFIGHWRSFAIHIYDSHRKEILRAFHPFRIFFQRLEVTDAEGRFLGAVQRRFSILTKRFDVEDSSGNVIMEVSSPIWKIWTFPFLANGRQMACVKKQWSGLLNEAFTDKDNFMVEFDHGIAQRERALVLAAAIFIDLQYFETKANQRSS